MPSYSHIAFNQHGDVVGQYGMKSGTVSDGKIDELKSAVSTGPTSVSERKKLFVVSSDKWNALYGLYGQYGQQLQRQSQQLSQRLSVEAVAATGGNISGDQFSIPSDALGSDTLGSDALAHGTTPEFSQTNTSRCSVPDKHEFPTAELKKQRKLERRNALRRERFLCKVLSPYNLSTISVLPQYNLNTSLVLSHY